MIRYEFTRGCLIGNLGQEMGCLPESFRKLLQSVFTDWQSRIADCLEEAKINGEIDSQHDCQKLAAVFMIGWEGAVLRAKLDQSPDTLELFVDYYISSLKL